MMRILQSSWLVSLVGCLVYMATTVALLNPSHFEGIHVNTGPKEYVSPNNDPSWKFRNPEFTQWVEEIKSEREALEEKARQLAELEQRLAAERKEILSVTQAVYELQQEFDRHVVRIREQEEENLKYQVKVLTAMSPESAVRVLGEMEEDEVVRILFTMKPDEASLMLETMSGRGDAAAARAARLTEKLLHTLPPEPSARSARR